MTAMVMLENVTKRFGNATAVTDASLALERGKFLTIVGPSGCGKTTLLRMIAGFETPTGGRIAVAGEDVSRVPPHRRAIGMVFQRLALFPHMNAFDNIAYPLRRRGHPKAEIAPRVDEMLALVRLDGLGERRPHELSGGQQQRVAIARALSFGPDLLLLDEPLSALDKKLREDMQLEFRRIQQDLGVTTINVTHDQREALVMSDQIVVMSDGRIEQTDTPHAVYDAPATRFVATFLGATTIIPATTIGTEGDTLRVDASGTILTARGSAAPGTPVDCAVRAEHVTIDPQNAENAVEGTISQIAFEGDRTAVLATVPTLGVTLQAFTTRADLEPGDTARFAIDPEHLFAFPKTKN
ncbi:MAG: ABC transporter ATP-binding protein [Pseudomonadota bacterium]